MIVVCFFSIFTFLTYCTDFVHPFPFIFVVLAFCFNLIALFFFFCSNHGHPFSSGVTLAKLAAVTMDEQGNETFDTSGALDKLRKVSVKPLRCYGHITTIGKLRAVVRHVKKSL